MNGDGSEMQNANLEEAVRQNLKDAGYDERLIAAFIDGMQRGETEVCIKELRMHRDTLLNAIHEKRFCIEDMDNLYLDLKGMK